jgi:CRP-like cAMP-binding protein
MAGDRHERVPLLAVEPDLARRIPPADRDLAERHLTARVVHLPDGPVPAELPDTDPSRVFGAILLEGLVLREARVMDQVAVQLIGPGDLLNPARGEGLLLPHTVSLTCAGDCRLGVLDEQLVVAIRRWPEVAAHFVRRADEQIELLSVQHAIGQMPRVHDRILATLWHLGERHGRVTPSGIHLPITLTHRLLGLLVGARRPTVSLALGELEAEGAIARRPDRTWLILRTPDQVPVPTELPGGHVPSVARLSTVSIVDRPRGRWDAVARRELGETVERLDRVHDETARQLAQRAARYEAIRTMAAGARMRAIATRRLLRRPNR